MTAVFKPGVAIGLTNQMFFTPQTLKAKHTNCVVRYSSQNKFSGKFTKIYNKIRALFIFVISNRITVKLSSLTQVYSS